ncbi:MAG TPA: hypothetical protein VK066_12315 [Chloroflexota bacterium]|nr:hypothetical protein [Chloroflexota bacterium]
MDRADLDFELEMAEFLAEDLAKSEGIPAETVQRAAGLVRSAATSPEEPMFYETWADDAAVAATVQQVRRRLQEGHTPVRKARDGRRADGSYADQRCPADLRQRLEAAIWHKRIDVDYGCQLLRSLDSKGAASVWDRLMSTHKSALLATEVLGGDGLPTEAPPDLKARLEHCLTTRRLDPAEHGPMLSKLDTAGPAAVWARLPYAAKEVLMRPNLHEPRYHEAAGRYIEGRGRATSSETPDLQGVNRLLREAHGRAPGSVGPTS